MGKLFHHKLYWTCDYVSKLGLRLINVKTILRLLFWHAILFVLFIGFHFRISYQYILSTGSLAGNVLKWLCLHIIGEALLTDIAEVGTNVLWAYAMCYQIILFRCRYILCYQHIETKTEWPPFRKRNFQMHFLEWKCTNFEWNLTEFCF